MAAKTNKENAEDEDKHREDKRSRAVERNGAISRALLHPARSGDFIGVREGRRTASPTVDHRAKRREVNSVEMVCG